MKTTPFIFLLSITTLFFFSSSTVVFAQNVKDNVWIVEQHEGVGIVARVNGLITYGDKFNAKIEEGECQEVETYFSFYTTENNKDILKLEGQVVPIKYNNENIYAKILSVFKILSGHAVIFHLGFNPIDFIANYYRDKQKISVELVDGKELKASDFFDVLKNEWSLKSFESSLVEAQALCRKWKNKGFQNNLSKESGNSFQEGVNAYKREDYETAYKLWLPLAEQGNVDAQHNLGMLYSKGQGTPQDDREAVKWYRKAADQGYEPAQYSLGVSYLAGRGVPQDDEEGIRWIKLAADKGYEPAQYALKEISKEMSNSEDSKGSPDSSSNKIEGNFQEGVDAYKSKDYKTAPKYSSSSELKRLLQLARQGVPAAQFHDMVRQWIAKSRNGKQKPESERSITATPSQPTLSSPRAVPGKKTAVQTAGTGFFFGSSGYILTNYHIVKNAKNIKVRFLNGDVAEAKIIIKDESNDIAFLKSERSPKLPGANISLGDSSKVKLGDEVFTIGFPMSNILGQQPRYSEGVINSLAGVGDDPKAFQISIPIQSGNSGGPLFNQKGEVVGIVSSSLDSANTFQIFGNAPQNVNFAIKSTFVKNLLPMIPDALISPTDIVVVPKGSDSLSGFINRVQNNIVLIESQY